MLKTCAVEHILRNNNMLTVTNKYAKTKCEISPSLTIKTDVVFMGFFDSFE